MTTLIGCGGSNSSSTTTEPQANAGSAREPRILISEDSGPLSSGNVVPASAVDKKPSIADEGDNEPTISAPDRDSPEWFILQITRIKLRPLGDDVDAVSQTPERISELRRERNEQLANLATEAIARTHKDKSETGQRVFDLAVHHLLDAELQLALAGEQDHIDAIYEHAGSLYERDRKSRAAIEAGQVLISFARMNAQRFGQEEPRWLEEYSRLARQFAKNFPHEERQAVPVLMAAGQSCEFHNLTNDAIQCYATIRDQYPENPAASRATAILRRLNLKGQTLRFAGPTLNGTYINASEMTGKPMLVVFWTTQAKPFAKQLEKLQELLGQIDSDRLNIVSVNLDDDDNESAVQTFLETNGLNWPTIFQTEPETRGWNNPIATYYGIQSVPLYWVVSSKGIVVETADNIEQIEPLLQKLIARKSASASEE